MSVYTTTSDSWALVPLEQLVEEPRSIAYGVLKPGPHDPSGIPLIRIKDLRDGTVETRELHFITRELHEDFKRTWLKGGEVLVSIQGTIGRVAIVPRHLAGANISRTLAVIRPKAEELAPWIRYALLAPSVTSQMERVVTGSTRDSLNLADLRKLSIPLAPASDRERIVAEIEKQFSRLDEAVANLNRVKANLKRCKAAVLKAAIEGRLVETESELARREGRAYEPSEHLLEQLLDRRRHQQKAHGKFREPVGPAVNEPPPLPEGWTWATVDQLAVVVRGASPRPAGDPKYFGGSIPWITVGTLTADEHPYLRSVPETVTEEGRERSRYVDVETLLLTNSGATLGVPKITLIGGCINDGVAALQDVDYPLKLYLLYFLRLQTQKLRRINQGAAQPNLNTTIIKAISVPLPPTAEQIRILAEVDRRLSLARATEAQVDASFQRASNMRGALLGHAFSRAPR